MLALGCDHGGYNLICAIKKYLDEKGIEYKILVLTAQTALIILFTAIKLQKQ